MNEITIIGFAFRDLFFDGKTTGPEMIQIPSGSFEIGQEDRLFGAEWPAHEVEVNTFSIGRYPVTFEEYDEFCKDTRKKKPDDRGFGRKTRPVINIFWHDAVAYCEWLSQQTGKHYRLPTEAEWEYACRAGSTTRYCYGDDEQRLGEYAWYSNNSEEKTHPVGEKLPNAWQLHDMHGNVWEWVQDWYDKDYYKISPRENPSGSELGTSRIYRGGSWDTGASRCCSAYRGVWIPVDRINDLGFRLAKSS